MHRTSVIFSVFINLRWVSQSKMDLPESILSLQRYSCLTEDAKDKRQTYFMAWETPGVTRMASSCLVPTLFREAARTRAPSAYESFVVRVTHALAETRKRHKSRHHFSRNNTALLIMSK